ncbi:MAG: GNAT family N-acetyltransferase [Pirellulales bacterium]
MSEVIVTPVKSWRDRRQFLKLPWTIYKGDPHWVPPLLGNQKELLGWKSNPFYEHADAQTFLARRDGQPVGRISAIINHAHNKYYKEKRGFFGFFESIDDQQVASALFDTAQAWFAERGVEQIRGPASPSLMHECGLLIDGFDSSPVFMMSYNPPYYQKLIEGWGFAKTHDLLAYIGTLDQLPGVNDKLTPIMESARERLGATIHPLDTSNFRQQLEMFLSLWNDSLFAMWGFVPVSPGEVRHSAKLLRHLLIPELALSAQVEGKTVGCVMALPDYNVIIKHLNGRLFPFGLFRLLNHKRHTRMIRLVTINVLPEYQRWGLGLVLLNALIPKGLELKISKCEFSWVAESNDLSRKGLEKGGAKLYKTYRMYDYPPPPPTAES